MGLADKVCLAQILPNLFTFQTYPLPCDAYINIIKAKGPGDTSYHKDCLRCSTCDKLLSGGQFSENNNMPYCPVCYGRGFGPKGFGFGGSVVSEDKGGIGKDRVVAKGEIEEKSAFSKLGSTAGGKKLW